MDKTVGAAVEDAAGDGVKAWNCGGGNILVRRVMQVTMFLGVFGVLWMSFYFFASPFEFPTFSPYFIHESSQVRISFSPCLSQLVFANGIIGGVNRRE